MTIEQGLVAHLLADGTVAGIVGTRIHPGAVPQGGGTPAIVYVRRSTDREQQLDGAEGLVGVRLRLDLWHTTYAGVKALADAVRLALNGVGLVAPKLLGAEPVQSVYLDDDGDLPAFTGDARDLRVFQDWVVIHEE